MITKMDTDTAVPVPNLFMPHPNLSDEVNRNISQSEVEGRVCLNILRATESPTISELRVMGKG